ncbi:hypothetical protein GCM10009087_26310 [Sphingomonas oligophenolica]|uniref:Circumsporozoite protein n=1 Tax=Sphingomonas oligophenolica TaxID=301154 RepID=A0ABU9Y813_9SPHN
MKKLVFLPMIAVAALGLAACKKDAPIDNTVVANETTLNSEAPIDANTTAIDDATANAAIDNATIVDNASGVSNVTAK